MRADTAAEFMHDLRLPLTVISSCAQMLELEAAGHGAPADPYLGMLLESVAEVRGMLEAYLDAWRTESAPFRPERGDLAALVRSVCRRWRALALEKGAELRLRADVDSLELCFDAEKLSRALQNLLANALRYTPPGECVFVELAALGDFVELRVRDAGPGPEPGAPADGHGLGLNIARRFAALHGGSVQLQAGGGAGCTFVLRLPLDGAGGCVRVG